MLKRDLGRVKLASLSAVVLRDFIDRRTEAGAGGVTIAADLSFLSAVLKLAAGVASVRARPRIVSGAARGGRETLMASLYDQGFAVSGPLVSVALCLISFSSDGGRKRIAPVRLSYTKSPNISSTR